MFHVSASRNLPVEPVVGELLVDHLLVPRADEPALLIQELGGRTTQKGKRNWHYNRRMPLMWTVHPQWRTLPSHGTSQPPRSGLVSSPSLSPWQRCSRSWNETSSHSDAEGNCTSAPYSWLSCHRGSEPLLVRPPRTDLREDMSETIDDQSGRKI